TNGSGALASLAPSASGSPTPDYTVFVLSGCPDLSLAYLYFHIIGDLGYENSFIQELTLDPFWEMVENGQGAWTHESASGWTDQWHISTETAWSPTHAWKCGDTGTGTYANHMDARLITPPIGLPAGAQLRFKHQMNAETSSYYPDSAYDGGIVEISVGGGPWTQLASPQYNKHFRYSAGSGNPATHPFPGGIACFSGDISWSEATCDLSAYSGNVQIRFRFGSDNGTGREGWYVDDIEIVRTGALLPPTNLQADIAAGIVTLTWNSPGSSRGLLGYNLYRNDHQVGSTIAGLTTTDDLHGQPYGTYTYHVKALYTSGESGNSNPAVVDYIAEPDPVVDLTALVSGTDIVLHWTATSGAETYRVYRIAEPFAVPTPGDLIGTTDATSYTDVGVLTTTEVAFYIVVAVNSN
ncbi:MAG: fibronectin type III domain-containing protein, partial [Calditrichaeota bacterium]|nr:fibronectin type III domain-containing protein [Calditrichota bacterium]